MIIWFRPFRLPNRAKAAASSASTSSKGKCREKVLRFITVSLYTNSVEKINTKMIPMCN